MRPARVTALLAVVVTLASAGCQPTLGDGVEPCRSVVLPELEGRNGVEVVQDDARSGCRREMQLTGGGTGSLADATASALSEEGWLLEREEGGVWRGWQDQDGHRFAVTVDPQDAVNAVLAFEEVDGAAPPAQRLEVDDFVPTAEPRIIDGTVLFPTVERLVGIDARTGVFRWSSPECAAGAWAAPVASPDDRVAVLVCGGGLTAIAPDTGEVLWDTPITEYPERMAQSPTVLVLQSRDAVRVLDLADGRERWVNRRLGDAAVAADDEHVYVGNDNRLVAFDADLGLADWEMPGEIGAVLAADRAVFVRTLPTFPSGPDSNRLMRLDHDSGERLWSVEYHRNFDSSRFAGAGTDGVALVSDDRVGLFDSETGEMRWDELVYGQVQVAVGSDHVVMADSENRRVVARGARSGRQVRLLGEWCGLNVAVAATTAVQIACPDEGDPEAWLIELA